MSKKILSILLAIIMIISVVPVIALPAFAEEGCDCGHNPIIYVIGRTTIYDDKDHPSKALVNSVDTSKLMDKVKECLPYAAEAAIFGKWNAYMTKLDEMITDFTGNYAPDCNGEVTNNSGPVFKWSEDTISKNHDNVNIYTYRFEYDCRLSPMVIADDLNDYIEAVKRVTGHDKVSVICRCVGVNYAFAYLYKYQRNIDYKGIDSLVIYDSAMLGCSPLEAAFSGTVHFEAEPADCYINNYDISLGDEAIDTFLKQTLLMLHETYGIELSVSFLNGFYGKLQRDFMPDALKEKGLSVRQLERLTGISRGTIQRA